ncbi:uncharacterized protein V6R79_016736 [Siganus canaliculatus]
MNNVSSNDTLRRESEFCDRKVEYYVAIGFVDIVPFLAGQPVICRLLWVALTSKKATDILNFNLALFHSFQYTVSIVHLFVLLFQPGVQVQILRFLLMFTQIGAPMSLCFICMERYVAVIHPMFYPLLQKYRFREGGAVLMWLLSLSLGVMGASADRSFSHTGFIARALPLWWMMMMIEMLVQFTIRIGRSLKKVGPGKEKLHPAKKKAFKTVCGTSGMVLVFYIPVTVLQMITRDNVNIYKCLYSPVCMLLLSAASVVHPLCYLYSQGKLFPCSKQM